MQPDNTETAGTTAGSSAAIGYTSLTRSDIQLLRFVCIEPKHTTTVFNPSATLEPTMPLAEIVAQLDRQAHRLRYHGEWEAARYLTLAVIYIRATQGALEG